MLFFVTVRWVSGLNQQFAKLPYGIPYQGFESPSHRALCVSGCSVVRSSRLLWEQEVTGSNPVTPTKAADVCAAAFFIGNGRVAQLDRAADF